MKKWHTLWKAYRWKLAFAATIAELLLHIPVYYMRAYNAPAYMAFHKPFLALTLPFFIFVVISMALVMRYFRESPRIIAIVYMYAFCGACIEIIYIIKYTPLLFVPSAALVFIFSMWVLLRVKAPEVSGLFKALAWINMLILSSDLSFELFHKTSYLLRTRYFYEISWSFQLGTYIILLIIFYKMMQLPEEHYSSLEREIDSIGEMT